MTGAPRVKLSPDNRVVVHTPGPIDVPWCAVWRNDDGVLVVEVFTDEQAAAWPEYVTPS